MRVLLSNDDGIDAAGLRALEAALLPLGELWVVAPATEQSAKSHSFTMHEPLRLIEHGPRRFSVSGTPADAVYLAVHNVLPAPPDIIVSGINRGSNLGTDVHYSGTVAAAREGAGFDIPGVALSLHKHDDDVVLHWETAQVVARRVVEEVLARGLPPGIVLNVNVPNRPLAELRGTRIAPMGRRRYLPLVTENVDPRGRKYYWIGGPHDRFDDDELADGPLCEAGFAVVTPLQLDITAHPLLAGLRSWDLDCSTT